MSKSRIPEPMQNIELWKYRWREPLPVLGSTDLPVIDMMPNTGQSNVSIQIGESSGPHTFARAGAFNGHPQLTSENGTPLPDICHPVWGYAEMGKNIGYLGPVIVAQENQPVKITWINNLPDKHPFVHPMPDMDVPGIMMRRYSIGHAVVHMHGARVEEDFDGYPMRKNGNYKKTVLRSGDSETYEYPNEQPGGATLWFHDHAMDLTAENVYAGLAGGYLLRHADEGLLNAIVAPEHEVPLIIQDRSFTSTGELLYGDANYLSSRIKSSKDRATSRTLSPSPEFKGQAICVNGKLWPHLDVEPRPYRFRIYNGANSRMFVLRISSAKGDDANLGPGGESIPLYQIGSDGGIFSQAVMLNGKLKRGQPTTTDFLVLAPGERADVVVDFSRHANQSVFLTNHATNVSPFGNGGDEVANAAHFGHVMKFKVTDKAAPTRLDAAKLNECLAAIKPKRRVQDFNGIPTPPQRRYVIEELNNHLPTPIPVFFMESDVDPASKPGLPKPIHPTRNGWKAITIRAVPASETTPVAHKPGYLWAGLPPPQPTAPPNIEKLFFGLRTGIGAMPNGGSFPDPNDQPPPKLGDIEIWEIFNISPDVHPIHLHLVNFYVLKRNKIKIDKLTHAIKKLNSIVPVDKNENLGWKDTVRVNSGESILLLVDFYDGSNQNKKYSGDFVWHCHLIEHEDMGMMRPLEVK